MARLGPESALPPIDVSTAERHLDAHLLQGLWACRHTLRLRRRRSESVIGDFEKVRNHYGVNRMAQVAGEAALADQAYLSASRGEGRRRPRADRRRSRATTASRRSPPATNFVTIDCGADGAFALKVLQALIARDVFIRKPMAPVLDRCIRISVGLDHELDIFAEELPRALEAARAS